MIAPRRARLARLLSRLAGCLLGASLLAGCATLKVRSDYDSEFDFSQLARFAWLEPPLRSEPADSPVEDLIDPFARNSLLDKRVRRAVERVLLERGFEMAGQGEPQFRVQYHVVLKDRIKVRSYPSGYYGRYPYPYGYGVYVDGVSTYQYQEGTLIIDVIDAASGQIVWRGWAVGINREGYYTDETVEQAVSQVLGRFPPQRAEADREE